MNQETPKRDPLVNIWVLGCSKVLGGKFIQVESNNNYIYLVYMLVWRKTLQCVYDDIPCFYNYLTFLIYTQGVSWYFSVYNHK